MMGGFLCDVKEARIRFEEYVAWYKKHHPDFKGYIRQAAWDLGVAEIIDGADMKQYRFMIV